ncbi:MAG: hypothetical protein ACLU5F_11985 [Anaerovoracaceae bacterium]
MKKKKIAVGAILLAIVVFICTPFSRYPLSLLIMNVYSAVNESESLMEEKGIELSVPGGDETEADDWYPFVMTFNADRAFSDFAGESGLRLTILYNFPAFDQLKGCSRLYDPHSPYYCGFYGAYLLSGRDGKGLPYGFTENGSLNVEMAAQVPRFDYQNLVLADFGIEADKQVFQWNVTEVKRDLNYAGSNGWTRVDADLTMNGTCHERDGFRRSYLQYGSPGWSPDDKDTEPFAPVNMKGRVYGKYFKEWDTGIFFYVMAADEMVLENCDRDILSRSSVR